MHTKLCGHAIGEPSDYVEQAIKLGLKEIGFSDHAPLVSHRDPTVTMDFDELSLYHKMIEEVQEKYKDKIKIKLGIEADFVPGFEEKTKELLQGHPYDYVIGSVHYIESWAFDNPNELKGWDQRQTDDIYAEYFEHLGRSAASGLYDIIAHVDLVKKFGHRPTKSVDDIVRKTAQAFKDNNVVIEINTSGLRKPVKEIYPSLNDLKIYCEVGVPIVFGSDAHTPGQVGMNYEEGLKLAKDAGYKEYVLFEKRKIVEIIKID